MLLHANFKIASSLLRHPFKGWSSRGVAYYLPISTLSQSSQKVWKVRLREKKHVSESDDNSAVTTPSTPSDRAKRRVDDGDRDKTRPKRPPGCQLCREEGHFATFCPEIQRFASRRKEQQQKKGRGPELSSGESDDDGDHVHTILLGKLPANRLRDVPIPQVLRMRIKGCDSSYQFIFMMYSIKDSVIFSFSHRVCFTVYGGYGSLPSPSTSWIFSYSIYLFCDGMLLLKGCVVLYNTAMYCQERTFFWFIFPLEPFFHPSSILPQFN